MKTNDHAFTRIELLFCAAAIALVLIPALSVLASNKTESQRIICFNNLRQIGRGFQMWASDNGNANPWRVPPPEGTEGNPLVVNLWYQFAVISNQLRSPKLLVCPSDSGTRKIADNWSGASGGFVNAAYRNNAVSYILSPHSILFGARVLLSGDRNIRPSAVGTSCSYVGSDAAVFSQLARDSQVRWTNSIHGAAGHLAFGDGSVEFATSSQLQSVVNQENSDNAFIHYLAK